MNDNKNKVCFSKNVMSWRCLLGIFLLISACHPGCDGHSISVVVNHRHTFAVKELKEPTHIKLPRDVEAELKFEPRTEGKQPKDAVDGDGMFKVDIENKEDYNSIPPDDIDYDDDSVMNSEYDDKDGVYDDDDDDDVNENDDDLIYNSIDNNHNRNEIYQTKQNDEDVDTVDIADAGPEIYNDIDDVNEDAAKQSKDEITELPSLYNQRNGDKQDLKMESLSDVIEEEAEIEKMYKLTKRNKRAAREQWRNSLHGIDESKSDNDPPTSDIWEDVTDEELKAVQQQQYIKLAKYAGWTLLTVGFFVLVGICFLRDPIACIFSFGTGCPCFFILCPCVRGFIDKHLNVKQMVKDAMNKYTPGVIVHDDGSLDHYEPTAEEVDYLKELMDELAGGAV